MTEQHNTAGWYGPEHEAFRGQVQRFIHKEILPHQERWENEGRFERAIWAKAGAAGLLCTDVPQDFGGPGADSLFGIIVVEELARLGVTSSGFWLQSEIVAPYIQHLGTDAQKRRWLPGLASGEIVAGIGMTEPAAGSDLRGITSFAERRGNKWLLRGQKVFIGNGSSADLFVVAAKTKPGRASDSITLFLVEASAPGFQRGRTLQKIGAKAQDTAELFFDDIELEDDAVLGTVGQGLSQLRTGLVRERLMIAVNCQARAEYGLGITIDYVKNRSAFEQKIFDFQNTRFKLAEMKADISVGRSYIDDIIRRYVAGKLDPVQAAIGKLWVTELLFRVADTCVQLHGGYGYMKESPISRLFVDSRVERITGGSSEIMKEIIGKSL